MTHPFRFGVQIGQLGADWQDAVRRIESQGYSTIFLAKSIRYMMCLTWYVYGEMGLCDGDLLYGLSARKSIFRGTAA